MYVGPKIGTVLLGVMLAATCTRAFAQEEKRETDAVVVSSTLFRPSALEVEDKFYRTYVAGPDETLRLMYQDRWRYHEIQGNYLAPGQAHMDIGANTRPGVGPSEIEVRSEFARAAFKMRVDNAIRHLLASPQAKEVRKAQAFVENLKAQSVRTSNEPDAGEFRMGYDLITDYARFEYVKGTAGIGAYQTTFLNSFTNRRGKPFGQALSLNVWKEFKNGMPSPSLGYNVGGGYLSGVLSKPFSPSVRGELIGVHPVGNSGQEKSMLLRMTYTF